MCSYVDLGEMYGISASVSSIGHHAYSQFERVCRTNSSKKMLQWSFFCDYALSEKIEFQKHLESVHSKDKSHKCSIYEFSFSRTDILERHANYLHEERMSQNILKL